MYRFKNRAKSVSLSLGCVAGALAFVGMASGAQASQYVTTAAIALPGGQAITSFDIGFVDTTLGRYYLADRSTKSVVAVNTSTNQVVGLFGQGLFAGVVANNQGGPNGVITVNHNEVWAGDGDGSIKVLNATTGALITTIAAPVAGTTHRADEGCWDPQHHTVLFAWDVEDYVAFFDTTTHAVTKVIKFDGVQGPKATNGIEQCQWNARTNQITLAVPEVNGAGDNSSPGAVVVLDGGTQSILATWPIPVTLCAGPQGMAIGPRREIGLDCNKTGSVVISDQTGAVLASFPGMAGGDQMAYEAGGAHYVFTGANHAPPQLAFVQASTSTQDQSVAAATGLHSVAADYPHRQVYFPVTNSAAAQAAKLCSPFGIPDAQGCILVLTYQP